MNTCARFISVGGAVGRSSRRALGALSILLIGSLSWTASHAQDSVVKTNGSNPIGASTKVARSSAAVKTITVGAEVEQMSASGYLAHVYSKAVASGALNRPLAAGGANGRVRILGPGGNTCENGVGPEACGRGYREGPSGGQAEMSIAVDATGTKVVLGFNDTRGFSNTAIPISLSGYAYSSDGGLTFTDGGQLPSAEQGTVGATKYPQVFGDPDVKYVPGGAGCQFIYASIMVVGQGTAPAYTGTSQTMSLHRSTDCGVTWAGPFEITSATRPELSTDVADKEFIDVDPDSGRVMMSWTNFRGGSSSRIRTTFSDNVMTATPPTWSASVQVDSVNVQGSVPRFAANGSPNVYVTWVKGSGTGCASGQSCIKFARSLDNGATFGAPISLFSFLSIDQIPGNDRVHSMPSMDVDKSSGPYAGNVYVVASGGISNGEGDILFARSVDGGATFQPAVRITPNPGQDRAQWFPYVSVDRTTGRVNVIYYDQSVDTSGDLTDLLWLYSDDGGVNWSRPSSLASQGCVLGTGVSDPQNCRPFRIGFGNDGGQPNIGDYIGATAQGGTLFATFAATPRRPLFTDVQPAGSWQYPDFMFNKGTSAQAGLRARDFTFIDSGGNGFADAGDQVRMTIPLQNFVTNAAINPVTYTGVSATLSSATPGVTFQRATVSYPNVAPGTSANNSLEYVFTIAPNFVPGTPIELALNVTTAQGSTKRLLTMNTGTPVATTVFSENFDTTTPGTLPAGWGTIHAGGANTVPWTTNNTFCATGSNGLFHANAEDGVSGDATRFERAASPNIAIPANSQFVTLEFDICYNTEDQAQYDPRYPVWAYDGAFFRITDFTAGRANVATWVEAFAEEITTGTKKHFPKHAPRSSDTRYFQDIPMWAGNSNGVQKVRMRFNGMAGSTIQLRPDYTQDSNSICATPPCGVLMDNIVLKSFTLKSDELRTMSLKPVTGAPGQYTGTITSQPIAPAGGITVNLTSSNPGITTIVPSTVVIPAGSQTSPTFTVTVSPATAGTNVTINGTGPSNARSAAIAIR